MQQINKLESLKSMRMLVLFMLSLCSLVSFAQFAETNPTSNAANHWIFGNNIHLEFKDDSVIQHRITGINWLEGSASLADSAGNLVYYSARRNITKGDNNWLEPEMYGSANSSQGSLFIKHPYSGLYYFFGSSASSSGGVSTFGVIQNDSIIDFPNLLPFEGGQKQQAINHQNGRDIWYANHATTGDSIFFFLIKKNGMMECPVVTHTGNPYWNSAATQGQMKFSPDGQFIAEVSYVDPFSIGIYHFDAEYPVTDKIYLHTKGFVAPYTRRWFYGLEFSPDNNKIYVSSGKKQWVQEPDPVILYQMDLSVLKQDSIENSWVPLDSLFDIESGTLQLAPNGKIYMAQPYKPFLGVIHNPNNAGNACNYDRDGLLLDNGGTSLYGLPTFNQSYFHTPSIDFKYEEDCSSNDYQFWGKDTFGGVNYQWKIRDIRNETVDIRLGKNISYSFPHADSLENKYEVTFIASSGVKTDSIAKILTIRPSIKKDFLGRDTFYCVPFDSTHGDTSQNDSAKGDFLLTLRTPADMHCIHWGVNGPVLEPYSSSRGDTIVGYENFYGHISANQSLEVDTAGIYSVRITNKAFCQAWDTITIQEVSNPQKPSIQRTGQELISSINAAEYRWYYNGRPKFQNTNSKIQPDSNGYWQVQLVSEYGCESELSDSFNVGFASIDDIEYRASDLGFHVFPNPSDGHISIEVPQEGEYKIRVTDLNGKLVYSTQQNLSLIFEFDLKFASGQYILTLKDKNGNTGSEKIEVTR